MWRKGRSDALRGAIEIATERDKGTTVTITLPLTLAIVDGLLVRIAEEHFVLPVSIVEECVELTKADVKKAHGRNIANIRGEIVPYIRLRNEFKITGDSPDIEQIVITGVNGERIGFVVDHVIGEHQTVIKNLGKLYKDTDTVSGATILGDGTVALIIDAMKLVRNVEATEVGPWLSKPDLLPMSAKCRRVSDGLYLLLQGHPNTGTHHKACRSQSRRSQQDTRLGRGLCNGTGDILPSHHAGPRHGTVCL